MQIRVQIPALNGENLYFENAERQAELKGMQLFVIPVTSNLLIKPSIAMDKEFAFALANTIPVLPIMPEGGLEDKFYKAKFGDFQYEMRKLEEAKRSYTKMNALASEIPETEKNKNRLQSYLSVSFEKLGEIAQAEGDLPKAKEYYTKALEISQQLAEKTQTISNYDDLAVSYFRCALVDVKNPNKEMLKEALDIWTLLSEMCPDYVQFREHKEFVADLLALL